MVKKFYLDNFGIKPDLVELLADNDILTMCASGSSNKSISDMFDIEESDIEEVLLAIFSFAGWKDDLEINPLYIYNALETESFASGLFLFNKFKVWIPAYLDYTQDQIKTMFRLCKRYTSIANRIEREWF